MIKNNNRRPLPPTRKTFAGASDRPNYTARREESGSNSSYGGYKGNAKTSSRSRNSLVSLTGGNLASPTINPIFNSGPVLKTNSPTIYPEGPIVRIIPLGGV